jgi:type VI protein secretion system component Hcp
MGQGKAGPVRPTTQQGPAVRARGLARVTGTTPPSVLAGAAARSGDLRGTLATADSGATAAVLEALQGSIGNASVQRKLGPPSDQDLDAKGEREDLPAFPPSPPPAGQLRLELDGRAVVLPIEGVSFGGSRPTDAATGKAAGRPDLTELHVTRATDRFSPKLVDAMLTNRNLGQLTAEVTRTNKDGSPGGAPFTYHLDGVAVRSAQHGGSAGGSSESLSFGFSKMALAPTSGKAGARKSAAGGAGLVELQGLLGGKAASFGIESLSWGITSPGGATARKRPEVSTIVLTKAMDDHSHLLWNAFQTNKAVTGTITATRKDESGRVVGGSKLTLRDAHIVSISQGSSGSATETVALACRKVGYATPRGAKEDAADAAAELSITSARSGTMHVPVRSWSWGTSTPTDPSSGGPRGKAVLHDFTAVLPSGPSTVKLLAALQANERLRHAQLIPKSGPALVFAGARVSSVQLASSADGDSTMLSLGYAGMAQQSESTSTQITDPESGAEPGALDQKRSKVTGVDGGAGRAGTVLLDLGDGKVGLPIESFSFGATRPTDPDSGQATGRPDLHEVLLTRVSDLVSPRLLEASVRNRAFETVEVVLVTGTTQRYELRSARITSVQQSGSSGGAVESVALSFADLHMDEPSAASKRDPAPATGASAGTLEVPGLRTPDAPIPITSLSWGMDAPGDAATGQATRRAVVRDVTFTKGMDASSPLLLHALRTNKPFAEAKLTTPTGVLSLTGMTVTNVQHASAGEATESVSVRFDAFELASRQAQDPAGGRGGPPPPATLEAKAKHGGKIETPVSSWSWGGSVPTTTRHAREPDDAGDEVVGRARLADLALVLPSGVATGRFLAALQVNDELASAVLRTASGQTYEIGTGRVSSLSMGSTAEGDTTQLTLAYRAFAHESGGSRVEATPDAVR